MKNVLYFAENALSAIQGGGIVAYAVLQGLPAENLLGFYDYRNITPVPEYAERFVYLGPWRAPNAVAAINRLSQGNTTETLRRLFPESHIQRDLAFVEQEVRRRSFAPEVVYFAGLSYRYLRVAVLAAERYDVPMIVLHMDDWMQVEREEARRWGASWHRRIVTQLKAAAARSLVSTTNSPRLAEKLTTLSGYRHVPANNCCSDLMAHATKPVAKRPNRIPIITYAGAMNHRLQGETLRVLASAISELNAEGTRVHLHIYTPWEFAPDANSIRCPNAVFYKGQVRRERLADIYRRSDFLVTTVTYRERHISLFRHSLSTKLSEYLCAGKPVISMGHRDWHLHEYVQDHGCGFSILMDEQFSRARIKEQIKRILATEPSKLARIGVNNRALWERAHDVAVVAQQSRRAVGLETGDLSSGQCERRGALWMGDNHGPVPLAKLQAIARRLVDVFEHTAVDLIGAAGVPHPQHDAVIRYCRDIGLHPTLVTPPVSPEYRDSRWEVAGSRWSLAPRQRRADAPVVEPLDVFEQVAKLRGSVLSTLTPVDRVINQLTVRVSEASAGTCTVWFYGSASVGRDMIKAIEAHPWLSSALTIGGFLSSPGRRVEATREGYPWRTADEVGSSADLIVVASETSRLAIQEELTRLDLLDRMVPAFGLRAAACVYERDPHGPGQEFVTGSSAYDYAARELVARTKVHPGLAGMSVEVARHGIEAAA